MELQICAGFMVTGDSSSSSSSSSSSCDIKFVVSSRRMSLRYACSFRDCDREAYSLMIITDSSQDHHRGIRGRGLRWMRGAHAGDRCGIGALLRVSSRVSLNSEPESIE